VQRSRLAKKVLPAYVNNCAAGEEEAEGEGAECVLCVPVCVCVFVCVCARE